jgi:hypothetical protein
MRLDTDTLSMSSVELCEKIEVKTKAMMLFWKSAHGWAPIDAAGLLTRSMLDWQASLSSCLAKWCHASTDGELILAWANLGALVEGQLKLFLSVYYDDYCSDAEGIKDRRGKLQDPDLCTLEPLRQFFVKRIWTVGIDWNPYVERVLQRRNAIHAFRHRDLGTFEGWVDDLRYHLSFVRDLDAQLPYPDEY